MSLAQKKERDPRKKSHRRHSEQVKGERENSASCGRRKASERSGKRRETAPKGGTGDYRTKRKNGLNGGWAGNCPESCGSACAEERGKTIRSQRGYVGKRKRRGRRLEHAGTIGSGPRVKAASLWGKRWTQTRINKRGRKKRKNDRGETVCGGEREYFWEVGGLAGSRVPGVVGKGRERPQERKFSARMPMGKKREITTRERP